MPPIPRDTRFDSTLALLSAPYDFISLRCARYRSDLFEARLLLRRTICMKGPEAAELLCDIDRFERRGAMPLRIQKTLLGQGGVQGLDDAAHRHRKAMFMALMTTERIGQLGALSADAWRAFSQKWATSSQVTLYSEVQELLTRAVCEWAGIPLEAAEVPRRTRQLTALFDAAGAIGPRHWWSRLARRRAERWIGDTVRLIRADRLTPPEESPAHVIAWHRGLNGELLHPRVAAVELLNLLRPTVAVSVYIVHAAHALHRYPECRERLRAGEDGYVGRFVQEVRRFYPFFPAVAARVRRDFDWKGYRFPRGRRVMLDLYGTNYDARSWDAPEEFRPERFQTWDGSPFNFIPQGPGNHYMNHRCPGEWITLELMKVAVEFLACRLRYDVPEQDLRIDRSRLPAIPQSRFLISKVQADASLSSE